MPAATPYKAVEDRDLLLRYKAKGELDVLGELYNRYMSMVYGACLKYLKDREESRDAVMLENLIRKFAWVQSSSADGSHSAEGDGV